MKCKELANVNGMAIVKGGNKVLAFNEFLDGSMLIDNGDNTYYLISSSIADECEVKQYDGDTLAEKVFNYYSKLVDDSISKHGELTTELYGDTVSHGTKEDYKEDYYISPEMIESAKEKICESSTVLGLEPDLITDEIPDSEVIGDFCLPDHLIALNMEDISVWFK